MIKKFNDYLIPQDDIDFDALGSINESHQYSRDICSVMDKITFYVKRAASLENSNLNESTKSIYNRDIRFNKNERIAASCIFNEMFNRFESNIKAEIALCEHIINRGNLLEEGVEYDIDYIIETFSISEGIGDWVKKKLSVAASAVKNTTQKIMDGGKELATKGVEVVKATKDNLVGWAKEAKKDFEKKYAKFKEIIEKIVKKGIDGVTEFINSVLDVFTSIGDNLVDAVKQLGGLTMDKGEKTAELTGVENPDKIYKNAKSTEEKSFINNVINRANAILNKDKDNAAKLMNESLINESIVDNKFIAWLAGYKSDGTKMSWWKCILIGLCASLVVWVLPKVLVGMGLGVALAAFIAAFVGLVWNTAGILKLIYRRNKERKPGEKFFNKTTAIFFTLSVLCWGFSATTFVSTVAPLMREICNYFGWVDGENLNGFAKMFYNLTVKVSPENAFQEGGIREWTETVKNQGGDVRATDMRSDLGQLAQSKDDALRLLNDMPGATQAQKDAAEQALSAAMSANGSMDVYKALEVFKDNNDLPMMGVFDTSKWGGSAPIAQAIKELQDAGSIPDSVILGTIGSETTTKASNGVYGFAQYLMGADKEQMNTIFQRAAEIAGQDASTLHLNIYGTGVISDVITHTETVKGAFDVLAPNVPFLPMVMPFFDKKKWGQYKIRFASATRGGSAYTVDRVEMMPFDKVDGESPALNTLKNLHNRAWEDYQKTNYKEEVNEGLFNKKKEKKEEKIEEPQVIVFYVKDDESTNNANDNVDKEKKENKKEIGVGVVIDTLTMMCADVCDFNKSVEKRRRPQPYFMKGLLSRLSYRPLKNEDNDTKEYIRTTLGQTMKTLILQNVLYGAGKKYIDTKIDGKKAEYTIRETTLGDNKKIVADKAVFELGNFSPAELIKCLSDDSSTNKVAYEFLDGCHASKITIRKDANGNIKSTSASKDNNSIENVKYYKVSKASYKEAMEEYEKKRADYKAGKLEKRPAKPTFIKTEDGEYFKRASKKMMADPANKRKKLFDFVDIRIIPLLKKGKIHDELIEDKIIKKALYTTDDKEKTTLRKDVVDILKPFLYRPEKTFAREDEHNLAELLKDKGVEGEKLGWFKNLFKDAKQLHDTFKKMVEIIWDNLSDERRTNFKKFDFNNSNNSNNNTNEEYIDTTLYDILLEGFGAEFDDDVEYEYDINIITEEDKEIPSFRRFLIERYDM